MTLPGRIVTGYLRQVEDGMPGRVDPLETAVLVVIGLGSVIYVPLPVGCLLLSLSRSSSTLGSFIGPAQRLDWVGCLAWW